MRRLLGSVLGNQTDEGHHGDDDLKALAGLV